MMKSKIYNVMGALLLGLALTACHQDSDVLTSYNNQDALAFNDEVDTKLPEIIAALNA